MAVVRKKHTNGFTIVELLIVVVVIAILAAITIVAFNGVQNRAKASAIASGINSIEKSLALTVQDNSLSSWWLDEDYRDTNDESTLQALIDGTTLNKYLKSPPNVMGEDGSFWEWDNDADESSDQGYNPAICPIPAGTVSDGVNLKIQTTQEIARIIDKSIDDNNLNCGKFRLDPNDIPPSGNGQIYLYLISSTADIHL